MATRASPYRPVEPALVEDRSAARQHVTMLLEAAGSDRGDAVLLDLSVYGCRLAATALPACGDRLTVALRGGPAIAATAIWARDGEAGCRFDEPISRARLRAHTVGLAA